MTIASSLIGISVIAGIVQLFIKPKSYNLRKILTIIFSILIIIGSIFLALKYIDVDYKKLFPGTKSFEAFSLSLPGAGLTEVISYAVLAGEIAIAFIIIFLGVKYKKYLASILALVQIAIGIFFEVKYGHSIEVKHNFYIDRFTLIMVLIIGIIGSLICIYAVPYMKEHAKHLKPGEKDRSSFFFFMLFIFLGAMFGIVVSNNLLYLFFFWEVTTLASFLLIGYTKTKEAIQNSFRAVIFNLIGGLCFAIAIFLIGGYYETVELDTFIKAAVDAAGGDPIISVVLLLLGIAGLTKAAQLPFSQWLLGAMVAPTPTSALLHSSTMVKAGVFLIIKIAPALEIRSVFDFTGPGFIISMVGAVTFLIASFQAISQSNAKRVLAYSTVSNLGLIIACAGVGTEAAIWAAIFLVIFHAVTKSLLFLLVGTAEHNVGSRDIETFDGLFSRMPKLATCMIIGISAMYLAPFGMLISKWSALQTFITEGTPFLVLIIAFGSATTLFYWSKWLGKMVAIVSGAKLNEYVPDKTETTVQIILSFLVAVSCIGFPVISRSAVIPYIANAFSGSIDKAPLGDTNIIIMVLLTLLIIVIPILFYGRTKKVERDIYLSGVNKGDNRTFEGAMLSDKTFELRNWYMEKTFPELTMKKIGDVATLILYGFGLSYALPWFIMVIKFMFTGGVE